MLSISRRPRPLRAAFAAIALVCLLGGVVACGGVDLSKQNFQRTTVPVRPAGGQGKVPVGPIDDPAVALAKLRRVAPCGLLGGTTLSELGNPGEPEPRGWSRCRNDVTDAGGKEIGVILTLGEDLIGADAEEATGGVGGLPLIVRKQDKTTCFVTALTSKQPAIGITAQVEYAGGQPCEAGRVVVDKVVRQLHAQPPKLTSKPGSLAQVAPCSVVDGALISEILGQAAKPVTTSLHTCQWRGATPTLRVGLRSGAQPDDSDGQEVDLGGGITGYTEQLTTSSARCEVTWTHLRTDKHTGEIVSIGYTNYDAKPEVDKPCEKVVKIAKNVVSRLPQPA